MKNQNLPCIIGVAQKTWHVADGDAPHPLVQATEIAKAAATDCGNTAILQHIDELDTVLPISWSYDNLCEQLANSLDLATGERKLSGLSGTSPQRFINEAADSIIKGDKKAVLVCGAEAFATRKRAKKEERRLDWPKAKEKPAHVFEDPFIPTEIAHEVFQAYTTFAILDSARRAHLGLSLDDNRQQEAEMMARLSDVAAKNPNAWFPTAHQAEDLFAIQENDRMVAYPFTKNTMAFMDVDMAAAVIIVSDKLADELGVPPLKRVYLHGWDYAKEPPYIAQREELWRCPSMEVAGNNALKMANKSINDINHLDIYSCFASSLNFTRDALGIDDNQQLTVTGGLPYFGGPGNNYTTHSVATLVGTLRDHPEEFGLISGVGMHMTNHVFGVYGSQKPDKLTASPSTKPEQPTRKIIDEVNGPAKIMAYTVVHARHGNSALAVCETENGQRCYARCTNEETLKKMQNEEWIGKTIKLTCNENKVNSFD